MKPAAYETFWLLLDAQATARRRSTDNALSLLTQFLLNKIPVFSVWFAALFDSTLIGRFMGINVEI